MSRNMPGFSISNITAYSNDDPYVRGFIKRMQVETHAEFLDALYDDIRDAVEHLRLNPQHFLEESEDGTTTRLIGILHGKGYRCGQLNTGGNVDITVENIKLSFRWIGEAKKYNSLSNLRDGYKQLSSRYIAGSDEEGVSYGGMIAYLRRPNAVKLMADWRESFEGMDDIPPRTTGNCIRLGYFAFNSEHLHIESGLPFKVWHLCVRLHHAPIDKSAIGSKKYSSSKKAISNK